MFGCEALIRRADVRARIRKIRGPVGNGNVSRGEILLTGERAPAMGYVGFPKLHRFTYANRDGLPATRVPNWHRDPPISIAHRGQFRIGISTAHSRRGYPVPRQRERGNAQASMNGPNEPAGLGGTALRPSPIHPRLEMPALTDPTHRIPSECAFETHAREKGGQLYRTACSMNLRVSSIALRVTVKADIPPLIFNQPQAKIHITEKGRAVAL
ncbi:unnamed protein product, partial [Iphiclides podalirius]